MKLVALLFCITFIFESLQTGQVKTNEALLVDTILKNYDNSVRPVEHFHSTLKVTLNVSVIQIRQVDEKNQVMTTNIWRALFWKDELLKWTPGNYGNITQVSLQRSRVWTPDIQLYNSALYGDELRSHARITFKYDGTAYEVLPMLITSSCEIDVTWFPFDEQKCFLIFGSWDHPSNELLLELNEGDVYLKQFISSGQWKVLGITAEKSLQYSAYIPDEAYIIITYTIRLKRRSFYYFFNLLVPCGLIGFLAVLGFTLPPESDEKLSLGATILFSLIVFLNMIGESMPANSDTVPLIGTYFNCVMFTIALSVVSTTIINLNLKTGNPKEIRGRSKLLFLCWLPWILRMRATPNIVGHNKKSMTSNKLKIVDTIASDVTNGLSSDEVWKEQWTFVAVVVERLCLVISLIITFVSVTVFLIYAF